MNETKNKLEEALETEDDSELQDKELDLLFILSNLKREQTRLEKMGHKTRNVIDFMENKNRR